jgi:UDP-glucose 4-epimerase
MSTYLVTGGAGFVGSAIAKQLIAINHNVWIIDNLSTGYKENVPDQSVFIEGDCSKQETIDKLNNIKFDAIFHIAGQSSGEISFEDPLYDLNCNTVSTLLLLQYARKTGCPKIIYASTMSVYGDAESQIVSESDETAPKSFYAVGKLASEKYLKIFHDTYGIDFVALRYFNIYGPGQNMSNMKQGMVSIFLQQIISDQYNEITVKGNLDRFRDFVYIEDVVEITLAANTNKGFNNKIINIGTGKKTSVFEVIETLKKQMKIDKPILEKEGTPGDQHGIFADNTLLQQLGFNSLVDFESGIKKMADLYK